jgi:AraC-like DNA-binding protein
VDRRVFAIIQQLQSQIFPSNGKLPALQWNKPPSARKSLDELAASVNLSASRLRVLFKRDTQRTIPQYIKHLKLQRAQELLRKTYLRVTEIADHLDFDDASHFVRDFKREFGVTPTGYRKLVTEDQEKSAQAMNSHLGY